MPYLRLPFRHLHGFTIVELMISLAIISIMLGVVGPNIDRYLKKSRIRADINHISALLRFSRTTAISDVEEISICPTSNFIQCSQDWSQSIMVFEDKNNNHNVDDGERILASKEALRVQHKITGPKRAVRFRENGSSATPASLVLCPTSNDNMLARALFVSLQGRIRLSEDSNGDDIHELASRRNISCEAI